MIKKRKDMNEFRSKRELQKYVGDYSQVFGIKDYTFNSGKAKGVRALEVKNGKGIEMTILADKALDIPYLSFNGINIGFMSKTGICAPTFYCENGSKGFMQNFDAGFLTTCGLTYMGSACEDNGEKLGLHGPLANTPAEDIIATTEWKNDIAYMKIAGTMKEACVLDMFITLEREIQINCNENKLIIKDIITNRGFKEEPLMLLYHMNFGYPFLDKDTRVYTNLEKVVPRDEVSKKEIDKCFEFEEPIIGYEEKVYSCITDNKNKELGKAFIHNKNLDIGIGIKFSLKMLPWLNYWKCPRAGDYVLGIEPGTCNVSGRDKARRENTLQFIQPGEEKEYEIEIEFIDSKEIIENSIHDISLN